MLFKKKEKEIPDVGQEDNYDKAQQQNYENVYYQGEDVSKDNLGKEQDGSDSFVSIKEDDVQQNEGSAKNSGQSAGQSYQQDSGRDSGKSGHSSYSVSGGFSANSDEPYSDQSSSEDYSTPKSKQPDLMAHSTIASSELFSTKPSFEPKIATSSSNPSQVNMEFERINGKFDYIMGWIKQFYERFAQSLESLGELRSMTIDNEKNISKAIVSSTKAVELVKEVQPEKLRIDLKKTNMRIDTLLEKIELNKQFMDKLSDEIKALNRRAEIFIGTDELLKLNDEVKKDLIQIKNIEERVRVNADKTEQIFIELKKGVAEVERLNDEFGNFKDISSELKRELGKVKIQSNYLDQIKKVSERSEDLVQQTAVLAKSNKEAIGNFRFEDYQEKIDTILKVIEILADQFSKATGKPVLINQRNFESGPSEKKSDAARDSRDSRKSGKNIKAKNYLRAQELEDMEGIPELPEFNTPKQKALRR
jgi:hypothetical protein